MVELERDINELITERVELIEPGPDDLTKTIEVEIPPIRVQFDHRDLEGVHMHVWCLAVQQYRVPPA
jgi:hypothetical protein